MIGAVQDQSPNPNCAKYNCCGYEDFGSHHFAFRVGFLLSSPHPPVTQEQAIQSQEALKQVISFEDIFGHADLATRMQQSMGVTAEAPAFENH
jgi:hypothetical protein